MPIRAYWYLLLRSFTKKDAKTRSGFMFHITWGMKCLTALVPKISKPPLNCRFSNSFFRWSLNSLLDESLCLRPLHISFWSPMRVGVVYCRRKEYIQSTACRLHAKTSEISCTPLGYGGKRAKSVQCFFKYWLELKEFHLLKETKAVSDFVVSLELYFYGTSRWAE